MKEHTMARKYIEENLLFSEKGHLSQIPKDSKRKKEGQKKYTGH